MPDSVNVLKVMVAGDGGTGKTTLIHKYVSGSFMSDTAMTIGVQFHVKNCAFEGRPVSLQLWDLGGQERFRFMLPSYTFGAKGAILLYDTTRMSSLDTLEEWVKICRSYNKDLPILFGGTKVDLVNDRSVSKEYAQTHLQPLGLFDYLEVSAKTGENVEQVFESIITRIVYPNLNPQRTVIGQTPAHASESSPAAPPT